jgi:hypothetical protein
MAKLIVILLIALGFVITTLAAAPGASQVIRP